jgi:hypothetical protein
VASEDRLTTDVDPTSPLTAGRNVCTKVGVEVPARSDMEKRGAWITGLGYMSNVCLGLHAVLARGISPAWCFLGSVAANEGLGGSVANSQIIRHIGCAWLITGFAVMFMLSSWVQEQNDSLVVPGNRVPYVATSCRDLCRYMLCLHGGSQDYHREHSTVCCEAHTF